MVRRKLKIPNLLEVIRDHLGRGHYLDTRHALQRQTRRKILRTEILYILRHGFHEKRKDHYEQNIQSWNYAIRGKTPDKRELRIIVSFEQINMLIITAIDLCGTN